jgi:methylated-DNA-[protein]-cysteine S-methyltransferase
MLAIHVFISLSKNGIQKITLKEAKNFAIHFSEKTKYPQLELQVEQWFEAYINRKPLPELPPCDLSTLPPFTLKVLEALIQVPFGESTSYQDLAKQAGKPKAARAVGNACNRNPIPLCIPCHRVLRKGGQIGGFAYGQKMKEDLLAFERL